MTEKATSEVCRLCLELTESFEPFWDLDRNMLEDILPELSIDPLADFFICATCSEHLLQSYEFRRKSLRINSGTVKIAPLVQDELIIVDNAAELSVKLEVTSQSCCLCHGTEELVSNDDLLDKLASCFPELENVGLTTEPATCRSCLRNLETTSSLISTCLKVDERVKNYCKANDVARESDLNLHDVASVQNDKEKIKVDTYSEPFVKDEPMDVSDTERPSDGLNLDSSSLDFYEHALLLTLLCRRRRNRRRRRRFWVGPLAAARLKKGMFYNLYGKLREDDRKFSEHFGMSMRSFDELLAIIRSDISGKDTMMRRCVPADEKLALTLRYLGTGSSMMTLHHEFLLGTSTTSIIIHTVCKSICNLMRASCIYTPDEQRWLDISAKFEERLNFPHCLGAIGGKRIKMVKPKANGSVVLLAVCDTEYRFTHIEVSSNDDDWTDTKLHRDLSSDSLNIPRARRVDGSSVELPFVFIGDNAFSGAPYLMRPYSGRNLCSKRKVFNYRLARARRPIDCTFGVLSNRWRIFQRCLDVSTEFAAEIVESCCILHNFVLDREGYEFEDTLVIEGLCDMERYSRQGGRMANKVREGFASYFVSDEGQVPWQMGRI